MKRLSRIWALIVIVFALVMTPTQSIYAGNLDSVGGGINGYWECWDDGTLDPCHNNLNKVVSLSNTDSWAVGNHSMILHWDGVSWTVFHSPTTEDLYSIDFLSPDDGWAVGGSTILHWDGAAWSTISSPEITGLIDIDMLSAADGWALGSTGEILHWDGSSWEQSETVLEDNMVGIAMVSVTDVWALGWHYLFHWNGSAWTKDSSLSTYGWLMDIEMLSANDGWVVGEFGNIFHWDGYEWSVSREGNSYGTLNAISMRSPTLGWAVGDYGIIFQWNGSVWSTISGYDSSKVNLLSIDAGSEGGWIVGEGGSIISYSGSSWSDIQLKKTLKDLDFSNPDDGWIVGDNNLLIHWDGMSWSQLEISISDRLESVAAVTPSNAWIASDNKMLHWNGVEWSITSDSRYQLFTEVAADADHVWAAGGYLMCNPYCYDLQSRIYHGNGSTWDQIYSIDHIGIKTLAMVSPTLGWAGGQFWNSQTPYQTLFQWNGTAWTNVPTITSRIYDIAALDTMNAWAVASDWTVGWQVFRWNGTIWSEVPIPPESVPTAVDISPEGDVWLGGFEMLRWNGTSWDQTLNPSGKYINAIEMVSSNSGWAVGENGVILEYKVPSLTINYTSGSPGSYFNLTGTDFPRNQTATVTVNGQVLGTVQVGEDGSFVFTLSTDGADEGIYYVTVSVNPSATVKLSLDNSDPLRDKVGTYPTLAIPAGIGFDNEVYLPVIKR